MKILAVSESIPLSELVKQNKENQCQTEHDSSLKKYRIQKIRDGMALNRSWILDPVG